ncbi:MAG: methionyl-tRNA formyltransferase [Lachnospiraceae bacterium]|nr:methionyl-tRNA formyltransferase [Lachnospiraceae bacterium]
MRIIFMGTPDFAVQVLDAIIKDGHEVVGVYTQPDKPKGRGKSMQFTPVKEKAIEYNIPVYQPIKVREPEVVEEMKRLKPDVIVVVAFGQILPETILSIPPLGCINVHASLLPKYRGAAPIQRVIIDGEKESGVTTMYMAKGLDTGDMIEKTVVPIDTKETGGTYHDKLAAAGAKLCLSTLEKLEKGTAPRIPQDDSQSCYAHMLNKAMGELDFQKSAEELERLIRGLNPWPSAYTYLQGKTLKVFEADVVAEPNGTITENHTKADAGTIVAVDKKSFTVQCGSGALCIRSLQLEGKKRMETAAFLLGYSVTTGMKLGKDAESTS